MRYLFGFLFVCAIGVALMRGCTIGPIFGPGCESDEDCNDGNQCTADRCAWDPAAFGGSYCSNPPLIDGTNCEFGSLVGVCVDAVCEKDVWCGGVLCDDDNECTWDVCHLASGTCQYTPVDDRTHCDFDGLPGLCMSGVCEADLCEGVECDDENVCTEDTCNYVDGSCAYTPVDGTPCSGGFCRDGACEILVNRCTADDLAAIAAGDEPDNDAIIECAKAAIPIGPGNLLACLNSITECLEVAGTTLTTECASCYGLGACCVMNECGPGAGGPCTPDWQPGDACDVCIEEHCQPLIDVCVGGQ